jgi:hypothetical protein
VWTPTGPSECRYEFPDPNDWTTHLILGNRLSAVTKDHYKLAPGALITPVILHVKLEPPFDGYFGVEISYGHASSPIELMSISV